MISNSILNNIMRHVVQMLDKPVIFVLLVMLLFTIILVGELIAEFLKRRYISVKAGKVIDAIRNGDRKPQDIIATSRLLDSQKEIFMEVTKHKNLSEEMKESLAVSLLDNYERRQNMRIKRTELIVKLGPTFGLLGTLIPLGPGIIALAQGDTATLSYSLLSAFDTTVIGLICGAFCAVMTAIRKNWYEKDRIMLTLIMEAVVECEIKEGDKNVK